MLQNFLFIYRKLNIVPDLKNNAFDFVRLFLSVVVVISHSKMIGFGQQEYGLNIRDIQSFVTLGAFAVFGFFAISGFLITSSLLNSRSISEFIEKRFRRILPGFWACLILTAIFFAPLYYWLSGNSFLEYFTKFGLNGHQYIWNNITTEIKVGYIGNTLDKAIKKEINGPLWSLIFELKAYTFLVLFYFFGIFKNKYLVLLPFIFFWFSHYQVVFNTSYNIWFTNWVGDYKLACLFSYFFAGSFLYVWKEKIFWNWTFFILSILLLYLGLFLDQFALFAPLCLTYSILFISFALPIKNLGKKFGDYSYGIYIYSWPIQNVLFLCGFASFGLLSYTVVSILLSIIAGFLSWHLVEKRFLRRKAT